MTTRRAFLKSSSLALASISTGVVSCSAKTNDFPISLAQWSLHNMLFDGKLDNLDWAKFTKETFGITALEYVNQFFCEGKWMEGKHGMQPKSDDYIDDMVKRASDLGMTNVLLMCDGVGNLGNPDEAKRKDAVEGHYSWLEIAKKLGCHSIRVNSRSDDKLPADEQSKLCAEGLRSLSEYAAKMNIGVLVENHGGLSSDGAWLAKTLRAVGLDNCGSLPDFGNFYVLKKKKGKEEKFEKQKSLYENKGYETDEIGFYYDRYQGIKDLMPSAKGVSAKSIEFDAEGNETATDYQKAMQIVKDSGYKGYVGIEYAGSRDEVEGVKLTKALIEKSIASLS